MRQSASFDTLVLAEEMKYDKVTLLTYRIEYPQFTNDRYPKAIQSVNRFYQVESRALEAGFRTRLYQMAVAQYLDDVKNGFPVRVFQALQTFEVTYNQACIISLYFDNYRFTGGAHGLTTRTSQTINLKTRQLVKLRQLYKCPGDYETYIKTKIIAQIKENPSIYFDNYEELVGQTFNPENFYCTPQGVVVYFQEYDIAPYSSGIREFLLPYNECIMDPTRKC